jgi:hypothetical protein
LSWGLVAASISFGSAFQDLVLGVVDVAQAVIEQIIQRFDVFR